MFSTLCTVHADTSHVLKETRNGPGGLYYELVFKIVLLCGLTELKAQIRWMENVSGCTMIPVEVLLILHRWPYLRVRRNGEITVSWSRIP